MMNTSVSFALTIIKNSLNLCQYFGNTYHMLSKNSVTKQQVIDEEKLRSEIINTLVIMADYLKIILLKQQPTRKISLNVIENKVEVLIHELKKFEGNLGKPDSLLSEKIEHNLETILRFLQSIETHFMEDAVEDNIRIANHIDAAIIQKYSDTE
jgi:hypothetical protein